MDYPKTQLLATEFIDNMELYAYEKEQVIQFRQARNVIIGVLNQSYFKRDVLAVFYNWLKTGETTLLKELIPSNNIEDFNVFSFIDAVKAKY